MSLTKTKTELSIQDYCKPENRYRFINDLMFDLHLGDTPPKDKSTTWIWPKQQEIIDSVYKYKNTIVVSANGIGKTFIGSVLVPPLLCSNEDTIILTTAPTWKQVEKLLWGEIKARFRNSKRVLTNAAINNTEIKISEKWYAIGLSTNEEENFQGFHAKKIIVIIDEASGVDRMIWKAISGIVNSDNAKLLAIGNPNSKDSRFYEVTQMKNYHVITIPATEHPNYIAGEKIYQKYRDAWDDFDEDKKLELMQPANLIEGALSWLGVKSIEDDYGIDSQVYQVRVMAQFPNEDDDTLIPYSAVIRHIVTDDDKIPLDQLVNGACDISRSGNAETVMTLRKGYYVLPQEIWKKKDGEETANMIEFHAKEYPQYNCIMIDADGVGGPVYDNCSVRKNMRVSDFHGGLPSSDPSKWLNKRSELLWKLRMKFIDKDRLSILIPNDPILIAQITTIKFHLNAKGVICAETKDDMLKRGVKSPDRLDSLMMSEAAMSTLNEDLMISGKEVTQLESITEDDSDGFVFVNGLIKQDF